MDKNAKKKPLRSPHDPAKDLYNAYKKNEERIIDIKDKEDMNEEEVMEMDIEEKVKEAIQDSIENEEVSEEVEQDKEVQTAEVNDEQLVMENERLKEAMARKTAEMENMRRRVEREKQDILKYGNKGLLENLLEIPDNMKQALDAAAKSNDFDSLKQGIDLIYKKTYQLFDEAGVKPMEDPVGKEFDFELHEAILHTQSEEIPENHIIQVVQPGYMYFDKVLRHAKVITSSGPQDQ